MASSLKDGSAKETSEGINSYSKHVAGGKKTILEIDLHSGMRRGGLTNRIPERELYFFLMRMGSVPLPILSTLLNSKPLCLA
jgi:hypothetical protein